MSKKDSSTLFPETILVYACDYVDGEPVYAVAETADDIPEDYDDAPVVVYHAHCSGVLSVVKTVEGI